MCVNNDWIFDKLSLHVVYKKQEDIMQPSNITVSTISADNSISPEEYLALEDQAEYKREYEGGRIINMGEASLVLREFVRNFSFCSMPIAGNGADTRPRRAPAAGLI